MENKIIDYINQTPENTNPSVLATLLSGLNKQSDWNQNNSAEADYIKNRPFYESQQYAILVDNITVNIDKYSYQGKFTMPYILEAGITYTLTDNGYSEEVTAYQNGDTVILRFMDEGFEIQQPSGGGDVTVLCMISGKHTISIAGYIKASKPIDEKYIPELSSITIKSSTEGSAKKFKITVDDSGTISATEVTL